MSLRFGDLFGGSYRIEDWKVRAEVSTFQFFYTIQVKFFKIGPGLSRVICSSPQQKMKFGRGDRREQVLS